MGRAPLLIDPEGALAGVCVGAGPGRGAVCGATARRAEAEGRGQHGPTGAASGGSAAPRGRARVGAQQGCSRERTRRSSRARWCEARAAARARAAGRGRASMALG